VRWVIRPAWALKPVSKLTVNPLILFSFLILSGCSFWESTDAPATAIASVRTDSTPEAEVKAAFVNVMRVAQSKQVDAFRQLINAKDVVEFDADEGDRKGSYEAYMAAIVSHPLKDYRIELTGSEAIFRAEPQQKLGVYDKEKATEVVLVRDEGLWKIGRSASSNRALSQLDSIEASPSMQPSKKSKRPAKASHH